MKGITRFVCVYVCVAGWCKIRTLRNCPLPVDVLRMRYSISAFRSRGPSEIAKMYLVSSQCAIDRTLRSWQFIIFFHFLIQFYTPSDAFNSVSDSHLCRLCRDRGLIEWFIRLPTNSWHSNFSFVFPNKLCIRWTFAIDWLLRKEWTRPGFVHGIKISMKCATQSPFASRKPPAALCAIVKCEIDPHIRNAFPLNFLFHSSLPDGRRTWAWHVAHGAWKQGTAQLLCFIWYFF